MGGAGNGAVDAGVYPASCFSFASGCLLSTEAAADHLLCLRSAGATHVPHQFIGFGKRLGDTEIGRLGRLTAINKDIKERAPLGSA